MPQHPNSLGNLQPGSKAGHKKRLTKKYITDLMDFMVKDLPNFLAEIEQLDLKDRVAAKLKIIDMVKPKDVNLSFEDEDGESTKPTWSINFIASPLNELAQSPEAEDIIDIEEIIYLENTYLLNQDEIKLEID